MTLKPLPNNIESSKTRHFLLFAFTLIIILIIISNTLAYRYLISVQDDVNQIIETQNAQIQFMHKMRSLARERIIKLQALTATDDFFEQDDIIADFQLLGGIFLETRQELMNTELTEEELTLLNIQREIARRSVNSQYKVIELVEQGQNQVALDLLVNQTVPIQNENISHMDQFILYQNHQNLALKSQAYENVYTTNRNVITISVITVILILFVAAVVTLKISNMVKLLSFALEENQTAKDKLADAQIQLEQKVEQRTKELQEANVALKHLAGHDSLTDIPNRRLFIELLSQEINKAQRHNYQLAVLYMDLDGFKAVNDALGHEMGDAILVNVSRRLKSSLRKEDLIARLGGDEFTICYSNIKSLEDVKLLCQIIIDKIKQPMYLDNHLCTIGISIGVSLYPEHGEDHNALLRTADAAMYEIKNSGKNNYKIGY
jgi:diguanylate cyclase (GGDEF)-like protein